MCKICARLWPRGKTRRCCTGKISFWMIIQETFHKGKMHCKLNTFWSVKNQEVISCYVKYRGVKILWEFWRFLETVKNLLKERFKHSECKYVALMVLFYNFTLLRVLFFLALPYWLLHSSEQNLLICFGPPTWSHEKENSETFNRNRKWEFP